MWIIITISESNIIAFLCLSVQTANVCFSFNLGLNIEGFSRKFYLLLVQHVPDLVFDIFSFIFSVELSKIILIFKQTFLTGPVCVQIEVKMTLYFFNKLCVSLSKGDSAL